jgi:hypothetical protein
MQTSRTRLSAVSAATLALVIAGGAAVSANPGDREDFPGRGMGMGMGMGMDQMGGPGSDGMGWGDMGGFGPGDGMRGPMGGMLADTANGFVRSESVFQTADGTVTRRIDMGTVASTGDASLEYTLATGETASVTTDDATQVVTLGTQSVELGNSGRTRDRLIPEAATLADLAAGTEVLVWAESQADGTFLAQRIVVPPAADATSDTAPEADTGAASDGSASDGSASDDAGAGSAITEVPASPVPADA